MIELEYGVERWHGPRGYETSVTLDGLAVADMCLPARMHEPGDELVKQLTARRQTERAKLFAGAQALLDAATALLEEREIDCSESNLRSEIDRLQAAVDNIRHMKVLDV